MGLFDVEFQWDNREHFLNGLPHKDQVRFALFCAKQMSHLVDEKNREATLNAINTVELWLEDKVTAEDCRAYAASAAAASASASAAAASAYAASATYAAAASAYAYAASAYAAAAAAAYAAYPYAVYAAYTAAAYAAAAADAADAADGTKSEQMDYLKELVVDNLSEEDRNCWLLVASL